MTGDRRPMTDDARPTTDDRRPCPAAQLEDFAAAARKMGSYGLMRCSSGNLSRRLDAERMLVKSSRSWMADLTADDISVCRIADAQHLSGRKPSVEIGFHAGCLRVRADINVVLHFQTPAATALACSKNLREINFFAIPEMAYYIGPIGIVPYILPGTAELASAVTGTMRTHDLAVLTNHGLVTVGKDFDDVIQKATFFELACDIILRAGSNLQPLTPAAIAALRPGVSPARGV
jgi:ribulose-5-phosphate 4-epimerase/fuculose-1-phosphate aldolase